MVAQAYTMGTSDAYVIVGNSALLKCEIPSFVADFVSVVSWVDSDNSEYFSSGQTWGKSFVILKNNLGYTSDCSSY